VHSEIGKGSKFSFLIPLTLSSGEMSSDPGALSDLHEPTAQSNLRMDAPHDTRAIEATRIASLQEPQSSNHMGESPGNTNNLGALMQTGGIELAGRRTAESMAESSNVPPPIIPPICGTSHSSDGATLRVLIVEVCIYLLF
jgi:hypothetical protein